MPDARHDITTENIPISVKTEDNKIHVTGYATAKQTVSVTQSTVNLFDSVNAGPVVLEFQAQSVQFPKTVAKAPVMQKFLFGYGTELPQDRLVIPALPELPVSLMSTVITVWAYAKKEHPSDPPRLLMASTMQDGTFWGNVTTAAVSTIGILTGECNIYFAEPIETNTLFKVEFDYLDGRPSASMWVHAPEYEGICHFYGGLPNPPIVPGSVSVFARDIKGTGMMARDDRAGGIIAGDGTMIGKINYEMGHLDLTFPRSVAHNSPVMVHCAYYMEVELFDDTSNPASSMMRIEIPWTDYIRVVNMGEHSITALHKHLANR